MTVYRHFFMRNQIVHRLSTAARASSSHPARLQSIDNRSATQGTAVTHFAPQNKERYLCCSAGAVQRTCSRPVELSAMSAREIWLQLQAPKHWKACTCNDACTFHSRHFSSTSSRRLISHLNCSCMLLGLRYTRYVPPY